MYCNREESRDIFLFAQTEFTDLLFTGFDPISFLIWNKKVKVKNWTDLNNYPSDLHSMRLKLSYSISDRDNYCIFSIQYIQPRNYTCKLFCLILKQFYIFFFVTLTSLNSWVVSIVDCSCEGCRFKSLHNFSCDSKMFARTLLCWSFGYLK